MLFRSIHGQRRPWAVGRFGHGIGQTLEAPLVGKVCPHRRGNSNPCLMGESGGTRRHGSPPFVGGWAILVGMAVFGGGLKCLNFGLPGLGMGVGSGHIP